jgi:DNA-binding transcriptional regulator YhcF (GntR family)
MVNQPVSRARVERFAQRHQLVVTADNGQRVIDYLATIRRWRAVGLAAGLAAGLTWHVRQQTIAAATCVALIVAVSLSVPVGRVAWGRASSLLVAALAVTAAVWLAQRQVLTRGQPVTAPDLIQADNAIRSRSLHALSGSGTALALYCALGLAGMAAVALPDLAGLGSEHHRCDRRAIHRLAHRDLAMAHGRPPRHAFAAAPGVPLRSRQVIVEIDEHSAVPRYEQIRTQIATMIATGVLAAGTRLPSIRQLAADLGLATNTVARAYRQLEADGLVDSRIRHGTRVTHHPQPMPATETRKHLTKAAQTYLATAYQLGASPQQAAAALRAAMNRP